MIDMQYKLRQLTGYLGVKKMKQLGFTDCTTCKQILTTASQFSSFEDIKDVLHLTPIEQFEQFNTIYSLFPNSDTTSSISEAESSVTTLNTDTTDLDTSDTILENEATATTLVAEQLKDIYHTPQTEKQLMEAFIHTFNQLNIYHEPSKHDIGYVYDPARPLPEHSIMCPECGKLYVFDNESSNIKALPVYLSDVEYEMIKGVYVDIVL